MLFEKRQQIAICVIAAVLVAVFVFFWYMPSYRKLKNLEQARSQQSLAVTQSQYRSGQLPALKKQLLELQKETDNHERQIPDHRGLGGFLYQITELMNEHNLKDQVIQPGEEIESTGLNCIPIDVRCKGRLSQLFEFYKSLQGLDRLVRIEHVKLENDTDFSGQVKMQTKANIYYRTKSGQG